MVSRACTHCGGTGKEPVKGGAKEIEYTKDMISELEGLYQAHKLAEASDSVSIKLHETLRKTPRSCC